MVTSKANQGKSISIVIATYNRSKILNETLSQFLYLYNNNIDYEIIIVDNNSSDDTKNIILEYLDKLPVLYLFEKKQGKNNALNKALNFATGDIIVFTDDDVSPDPYWIKNILDSSEKWPDVKIFGGKVEPVFPGEINKFISSGDFSSYAFGRYHPYCEEKICDKTTPCGANCWFKKSVFDNGICYDSTMGPVGSKRISGSEMELFDRLIKKGERIVYVPSALVYHRVQPSQLTLKYLLKRSFASGRGWVRIKTPDQNVPFLFGAPRYIYRAIIENILLVPFNYISGKNYYEPLMRIAMYLGCMREYISIKKNN